MCLFDLILHASPLLMKEPRKYSPYRTHNTAFSMIQKAESPRKFMTQLHTNYLNLDDNKSRFTRTFRKKMLTFCNGFESTSVTTNTDNRVSLNQR